MKMDSASPVNFYPSQHPLPTPSPFTISIASAGWTSRSSFRLSSLFLRFLALLFSITSVLSLATPSPQKQRKDVPYGLLDFPEFMYCFIVAVLVSVYSAYQMFKGVCDIAYRGLFISDKISDYLTFILDQVMCYLLMSSSSASVPALHRLEYTNSLHKAAIVSVSMSFAAFFVTAMCCLLSGYKLCKRIIW